MNKMIVEYKSIIKRTKEQVDIINEKYRVLLLKTHPKFKERIQKAYEDELESYKLVIYKLFTLGDKRKNGQFINTDHSKHNYFESLNTLPNLSQSEINSLMKLALELKVINITENITETFKDKKKKWEKQENINTFHSLKEKMNENNELRKWINSKTIKKQINIDLRYLD